MFDETAYVRYDRIYLEYYVRNVKEFFFKKTKQRLFVSLTSENLFLHITTSKDRCSTKSLVRKV